MQIFKYDIVFQEVPHQISLAFYVCGCPLKCPGCHSTELWSEKNGYRLDIPLFNQILDKYQDRITTVLFLGGEWRESELIEFLKITHARNLLTAHYTGAEDASPALKSHLDFLKVGPWRRELGGLDSPATNQIFYDLKNNQILNHLFQRGNNKEIPHDPTHP
ncbi:anaerobic ribonucleoside-triphosphate reductase activating protein [Bdellovibrio sp. HCB185ZH]|uniref:anaerobic ribonucleoside-triphosphate reductase activating protein n=1 Tax=Bdellovibrio sp. HCB185ZH TaxID=3394235 RepID=UPI0039A53E10